MEVDEDWFLPLVDETIAKSNEEDVNPLMTDVDQLRQMFRNQTLSNRTDRKRQTSEQTAAIKKTRTEKDKERKRQERATMKQKIAEGDKDAIMKNAEVAAKSIICCVYIVLYLKEQIMDAYF